MFTGGCKTYAFLTLAVCLAWAFQAQSAPMQPVTATIEGTVMEVTFFPSKLVKVDPEGPMFPCSPKEDYYTRPFYSIVVGDLAPTPEPLPVMMTWPRKEGDDSPLTATLHIDHLEDDGFFRPGMRIRVLDYTIHGDECALWYSNHGVQLLEEAVADPQGEPEAEPRGAPGGQ